MKRVVILISGRGSNMQAMVEAGLPVAAVISNRTDAAGLAFAAGRGIATAVVPHRDYATREAFDAALAQAIDAYRPDLVVLAGFMRILTDGFVLRYQGRDVELEPKRPGGAKRRFRLATQTGEMRGIGRIRCVFSKRKSDGNVLTLVTSDLDLTAEEVATGYGWRWEIEVTIKALKQHLGLGEYQHRWFEGAVHHLQLSCLAHLLLTSVELDRLGKKAQCKNAVLPVPSVRKLQNRLRAVIWRDILRQLRSPSCRDEIIHHLERSLGVDEGVLDDAA